MSNEQETQYIKCFSLKNCSSIYFFQNSDSMIKAADNWKLVPIIGCRDDDKINFPGVYAALERSD